MREGERALRGLKHHHHHPLRGSSSRSLGNAFVRPRPAYRVYTRSRIFMRARERELESIYAFKSQSSSGAGGRLLALLIGAVYSRISICMRHRQARGAAAWPTCARGRLTQLLRAALRESLSLFQR